MLPAALTRALPTFNIRAKAPYPISKPHSGCISDLPSCLPPQASALQRLRPPKAPPSKTSALDAIIHLAAKAGVRPSIEDPVGYQRANVIATQNLLEFAKDQGIKQFVFASSSSVYGVNPNVPWSEKHDVSGSPLTENGKLKTEQPEGTFQAKASSRRIKT